MTSDDNVVGRVKDKARSLVDGVFGTDDSVADEHPDIEYEPAPKQNVMHDGMVVLSEEQSEQAGNSGDGPPAGDTERDTRSDTESDTRSESGGT